jgi:nicotinamidase/pyrazinamidase
MKTAVFAVDMQKGFTNACPNELPVPGGEKIVAPFLQLTELTDYMVGSKDAHPSNAIHIATAEHPQFTPIENGGRNVDIYWNAHCIVGTKGYELIDGMPAVSDFHFFVYKGIEPDLHPYGACYHDLGNKISTGVIEWLLSCDVGQVIVVGLATDYCVATTAEQLADSAFPRVAVCLEACAGVAADTTSKAIQRMEAKRIQIVDKVRDIEKLLKWRK